MRTKGNRCSTVAKGVKQQERVLRVLVTACHVGQCAPPASGSIYLEKCSDDRMQPTSGPWQHLQTTLPHATVLHLEMSPLPVSQVPKLFMLLAAQRTQSKLKTSNFRVCARQETDS
jgi:hypothetical protein